MNDHLGGAILDQPDGNLWMPEVWQYMIDRYRIKSMVDVGCGGGWTAKWFLEHGIEAFGVEGWTDALQKNQLPPNRLIEHDYTTGPCSPCVEVSKRGFGFVMGQLPPIGRFDFGWCAEFVEHVEARFIPNFMATLRQCTHVLMTHAQPGQGGYHHVNEKPFEYWVNVFGQFSFRLDAYETLRIRDMHKVSGGWGIQTMLYFRNLNHKIVT